MAELKNNPIAQRVSFIVLNKETSEPLFHLSLLTDQHRTFRFVLDQNFYEKLKADIANVIDSSDPNEQ